MTETTQIQTFFDGLRVGALQSAGIMQVLPLLADGDDDRFATPEDAEVSTLAYGSLRFDNGSDKTLLVPCHTGYLVKQQAQNHAMDQVGLVPGHKAHTFASAMCIQSGQGGQISRGRHRMIILPHPLREAAMKVKDKEQYSKLWEAIGQFNARFGLREAGHMEYFLKHFSGELDTFVAQFEPVPDQIGAVIFVDGRVAGIERAPSRAFFKAIWAPLIRECYGSLAISEGQRLQAEGATPSCRFELASDGLTSLEDLALALRQTEARERVAARQALGELGRREVGLSPEPTAGIEDASVSTARSGAFVGQIIRDGRRVLYASLVAREAWFRKGANVLAA